MKPTSPDAPATIADLQRVTGLSKPSVLRALAAGQLPGSQVGMKWVIPRRAFELFCEHGRWPIEPRPTPVNPVPVTPIVSIRRQTA